LKTSEGFVLCHTYSHAGTNPDVMWLSPNHPIRYEISSTTGAGSFRYICSQESSEGSINEVGSNFTVNSSLTAAIPSNTIATIGTTYPIKAIRLKSTHRDICVVLTDIAVFVNSNDQVRWELQLNPTISTPLTYTDVPNSPLQEANGSAVAIISATVTTPGKILASGYITQGSVIPTGLFPYDYLTRLGGKINGVRDELVLTATPISATVTIKGLLTLIIFILYLLNYNLP